MDAKEAIRSQFMTQYAQKDFTDITVKLDDIDYSDTFEKNRTNFFKRKIKSLGL